MRNFVLILALIMLIMPFIGCIAEEPSTTTAPPTTVPPNVDTALVLASDVQAALEEYEAECETVPARMQECRGALDDLLAAPDPDYEALYQAFEDFKTAVTEYESAVFGQLRIAILLEHTTPIEGDLLLLKKETLPFTRPGGETCTFGELEGWGTSYWHITDRIRFYIREGIDGYDSREDIIESLAEVDELLVQYHDKSIGYVYYNLSYVLFRQSLYSDVLIRDCNPSCIWVSHPRSTDTSTPSPTTPPSTPPYFMEFSPLSATEVQRIMAELEEAYPSKGMEVGEMLDALKTLADDQNPDYTQLVHDYEQFKKALTKYTITQYSYYVTKIALDYTVPTEGDMLKLDPKFNSYSISPHP